MSEQTPLTYHLNPGPVRSSDRVSLRLQLTAMAAFIFGYILLPAVFSLILPPESAVSGIAASCGPILSLVMLFVLTNHYSGSFRKTMLILGFRRFPLKTMYLGLFIALGIMIMGGGVTLVWGIIAEFFSIELGTPPTVAAAMSENIWDVAALLITALAAAPVFEEVFFRRVIFGSLRRFMPLLPAMAIASLAFSALHLSLLQLPGLLLIGWIWQSFYIRSQTLWSSVILHFYNNLIAAVLLLMIRFMNLQTF